MTYTFISARYANEERTAIVVETKEAGSVALSSNDTPDEWEELLGSGIAIAAYERDPSLDVTRVPKDIIWRRATDEEAKMMNNALSSLPVRLRRMYDAAMFINKNDEIYAVFEAAISQVSGVERAAELLSPPS